MRELQISSPVRLLLEVAALHLQVKMLQADVTELKERLAPRDTDAV